MDVATVRAGPGGLKRKLGSELGYAVLHGGSRLLHLRCYARPWLSPASMVRDTAITDGNAAHWTYNRVGVTPGSPPALRASKGDSATFKCVIAGRERSPCKDRNLKFPRPSGANWSGPQI